MGNIIEETKQLALSEGTSVRFLDQVINKGVVLKACNDHQARLGHLDGFELNVQSNPIEACPGCP